MVGFELLANKIAGISVFLVHFFLILFFISFAYVKIGKKEIPKFFKGTWEFIQENSLILAFLVALTSLIGSLFYSEVIGYVPCSLCWIQRMVVFPQAVILGVALYKKTTDIFDYLIGLNIVGLIFGIYQYYFQMINYNGPCLLETTAPCFAKDMIEFGYITLPMMGITAAVLLITLTYIWKKYKIKNIYFRQEGNLSAENIVNSS